MKYFLIVLVVVAGLALAFTYYSSPEEKAKPVIVKKEEPKPYIDAAMLSVLVQYEEYITNSLRNNYTPGAAIAIVKDSAILFLKGFGVKAVGTKDSIDVNTIFRLGSVSKCFASLLTGILVEDSVLSWNDHVTQYLPGFTLKGKQQTENLEIKHLLSHTTGLPYHTYTTLVEDGLPLPEMIGRLSDVTMAGNVGEFYSYQNVAYSIIGEVISKATGKTYSDMMKQDVFAPLNMSHASLSFNEISQNENVAQPHLFRNHGITKIKISDKYYNVGPAGGVNASISDMGQWLLAMMGNSPNVVSQKTLDHLFEPVVRASAKNRNFNNYSRIRKSYYGLGWRILEMASDTLIYHGGYVNGYRSEVAISKKSNIGICVLSNAPGNFADTSIPAFFNLYAKSLAPLVDTLSAEVKAKPVK